MQQSIEDLSEEQGRGRHRDRRRFAVTMSLAVVALAALHNGYWVRSGDGEAYLGIARELWLGRGYRFNGNPVGLVPPLWPGLLAAGMHVSDAFAFLKLIPLLSVIGALACWFWILTRLANSAVAMTVVLTLAIMGQVFPLAITFHSDGLFFLLTAAAMLVAVRIRDRGGAGPTIGQVAALSILSAASVGVRWNGVPAWGHAAAIAGDGERWPRLDRRWLAIVLSGALTLATFVGLRYGMRVAPHEIDPRYDALLATSYDMFNPAEDWRDYADRAMNFGRWPAACLWHGLNLVRPLRHVTLVLGWGVIAVLVWRTYRGWPRREWIWPSMLAHVAFLSVIWPNAVARYVLPMAPLFMLAMLLTIDEAFRSRRRRTLAAAALIGSLWLLNAPLYAVELWVQRSGDRVSERANGGLYAEMAAVVDVLRAEKDIGEVAITRLMYGRGARRQYTSGHMRALNALLDRPIMMPPDDLCGGIGPDELARDPTLDDRLPPGLHEWCASRGVTHYLDLAPTRVVVHFTRLGDDTDNRWRLYRVGRDRFELIDAKPIAPLPKRVPTRELRG